MPTNIKDYSTTQASNTTLNSISVAEGMLPSNLNNAIRALMKNTRDWFNDAQWIEYGDGDATYTAAYVSGTSFTINGVDVTAIYHAGRRIKITDTAATLYGTIASSSFSTNTTVTVTWDSGSLTSGALNNVYIGALSKTNDSIPTGISAEKIANGTVSDTEFQHLNGVTSGIQTQLDAKAATITGGASTIATSDLTASRALASNSSGKVAVSSVTSTELGYVSGVSSAIQTQLDAKNIKANNLSDVASASTARTNLGLAIGSDVQAFDAQLSDIAGLTPTDSNFIVGDGSNFTTESGSTARTSLGLGSISTQAATNVAITGGSITGLSTPSANSDVAIKSYVDNAVAGLRTRIVAEAATTANIDLAADLQNGDTLDGVTLVTGDRVLVKDQSTASQNGLYTVVSSGTASRDTEYDTIAELSGQMVVVNQGTANDNKIFLCTTNSDAVIGSSDITFTQVTPSNTGTVTSIGIADSGAGEFTVTNTPVTSAGNISLAVNEIAHNKMAALTASRALESNGSGVVSASSVSSTELGYVSGVTSAIQTQINSKIANVVDDTTPQLGGNFDVNGNSIVSVSSGNITVSPNGSGKAQITNNAGTNVSTQRITTDGKAIAMALIFG